jgi:ankyrin repeat protein
MNKQQQLIEAVRTENIHSINTLLLDDPSLANARNEQGVSIILQALYQGQRVIAEVLLAHKAKPDVFEAAALGINEPIKQQLALKPQLVHEFSPDGFTALGLAAYFGRPSIVHLLLENGANPNEPSHNELQVCPLHSAVAHRLPEVALTVANILIKYGAKVNVAQKGGWTPLHQAAAHGNTELVKLLLQHGADRQATNESNLTPIQLAEKNDYPEIVKLLQ